MQRDRERELGGGPDQIGAVRAVAFRLPLTTVATAFAAVVALGGCGGGDAIATSPAPASAADASAMPGPQSGPQKVSGAEAKAKVAEGALLYDVRTPEEFAEGDVEGAVNLPVDSIADRLAEVPEGKAVVVYCRSGGRSARAAKALHEAGRGPVYDLGPMSAWPQ